MKDSLVLRALLIGCDRGQKEIERTQRFVFQAMDLLLKTRSARPATGAAECRRTGTYLKGVVAEAVAGTIPRAVVNAALRHPIPRRTGTERREPGKWC